MKWNTNLENPGLPDHWVTPIRSWGETPQKAKDHETEWLKGKIIGPPQATETYTVKQLEAMDIVGIYVPETVADRMQSVWGPFLFKQEQAVQEKEKQSHDDDRNQTGD